MKQMNPIMKTQASGGDAMEPKESGFSLIELLVAMVITVIVTGAIFGLVASSENSFRREPEASDRQQNIRVAMALIERDVVTAGVGMDGFVQAFTQTDAGGVLLNGEGTLEGALGPAAAAARGDINDQTDSLEMFANDGTCPSLFVCGTPGVNLFINGPVPACFNLSTTVYQPVYVTGTGGPAPIVSPPAVSPAIPGLLWVHLPGGSVGPCGGLVNAQPNKYNNPTGGVACNPATTCQTVGKPTLVRYEIGPDSAGVPCLWRSTRGRLNTDGTVNTGPPGPAGISPWVLVARGIEDMQVQYQNGTLFPATPAVWQNDPGIVDPARVLYSTIVMRVQVTLSARSTAINIQGGPTSVVDTAGSRLRGQLTTVMTPRAALLALQNASPAPLWR